MQAVLLRLEVDRLEQRADPREIGPQSALKELMVRRAV
jgi:hypothetical protein